MPGVLTEMVSVNFGLPAVGGTSFMLNSPTRGVLDNVTYTLSGSTGSDLASYMRSVQIRRGRERALDEITAGVASSVANNQSRIFDPQYAAGAFYGNIRPGIRVTYATNGITIFDGLIDDWNFDYPISGDSTASFDVVDCLAQLGAKEFDEWTTTAGQTTGPRLTDILNRTEVQFPSTRNLDTGTSTLQADLVTWGSNVLNYAQLVVKADLGQLFAAKDGTLTFYGRNRSVTGVGAPEFRDDGTGIAYSAVSIDYGTELLYNRVSVDAPTFNKQTVLDQTSIDLYGVRSLSISELPLDSESQALGLAEFLLNLYKNPAERFQSITVDLHGLEAADQNSVLALDIGSVVRVVYTPNRVSTAIDKFCLVEGVDHLIGPQFHSVTLHLSNLNDGFSGQLFVLDDATYGVLDTLGRGVLAF